MTRRAGSSPGSAVTNDVIEATERWVEGMACLPPPPLASILRYA